MWSFSPPMFLCFLASLVLLSIPGFSQQPSPLVLLQHAMPDHPFTVVGEGGALLGSQDGIFELWQNPVKVLQNVRVVAHLQDYAADLVMNELPATIEVSPSETVITLSHAAITVREHLLMDRGRLLAKSAALAYFEVHSTRPAEIVISFQPVMQRQWPAPNFGTPGTDWRDISGRSGYVLATDNPDFYGIVCMPGATPGAVAPYQERAHDRPAEFHLHFDPRTDDGKIYPLLTAVSDTSRPATSAEQNALLSEVFAESRLVDQIAPANARYYAGFLGRSLVIKTPDADLDREFQWAEISIDQSRVRSPEGIGLAAGWSSSDDSARPGFGWFFGRDTLWSLYAVNAYGDFELTRQALDLLLLHQRRDGKMMHEYSQTASMVDWQSLPYLYAAADGTPLFLMQMLDYVRASGDTAYLAAHWDNVDRAYHFLRAHTEDGLYSNAQGTGWVEEWPGPRPHQEIYLAALDVQAYQAMAELARLRADRSGLAAEAEKAAQTAENELDTFRQANGLYAFSRNADHTFDTTQSVFPAVAWWTEGSSLPHAEAMFDAWASSTFSVDWGIRSVPEGDRIYDPISYHHGSVWPLYTGWVALAEYRSGRTLQATERMRKTLSLDRLQDLGATTEVISGEFLEPLPRSSSHQLWSSAMAIVPVLRGLFGLQPDALRNTLEVMPHLPASWDRASLDHVSIGTNRFDIEMVREGENLQVQARSATPTVLCLTRHMTSTTCQQGPATLHQISVPLPPVEVDFASPLPTEGSRSSAMHVLRQEETDHSIILDLEAPGGSVQTMTLRRNRLSLHVAAEGAELAGSALRLDFPEGGGYVRKQIKLHW